MSWLELCLGVDEESAEAVSEVLAQYGYNGGVAFELALNPIEDGDVSTADLTLDEHPTPCQSSAKLPVILRTYLPLDNRTEELCDHIERALWHLSQIRPIGNLHTRIIHEQDWEQAWKKYYRIQRIATRTVIVPSWLSYQPEENDLVLRLDPGMAFGTGLHPTTQLCVQFLERVGISGQQVLDLGCGSGILSIAAAKLGAAAVLALDTDPVAVAVTRDNVLHNEVDLLVQVFEGSLPLSSLPQSLPSPFSPSFDFDVVVANIIASVLCERAGELAQALAPQGLLITSGILCEREDEVNEAFASVGLQWCERQTVGDWVALLHRHRNTDEHSNEHLNEQKNERS